MKSHRHSVSLPRLLFAGALILSTAIRTEAQIKVLIVDGQNNHQWATTTPLLKRILEESGRFAVEVSTTPAGKPPAPRMAKDATPAQKAAHPENLKKHAAAEAEHAAKSPALWAKWHPKFSNYAVVISNYNGERWPEAVRNAFVAYVRGGGGFVSYHAANNAFPEWPEYNEMIGVGGWGQRDEKSGPYLRLRDGKWIHDLTAGRGGSHGPQLEFVVVAQEPGHPILRGLPAKWMHAKDELYESLRGPAKNVSVLAAAYCERTKEHEPMLMAIPYGQGRVFHTALGHAVDAINGLGFQLTLLRGTEWAATGRVTAPAPKPDALPADRAALRPVKG